MGVSKGKVLMNFEVMPEQREQIRENAAWFGMKPAEFMRYTSLFPVVERPARAGDPRARMRNAGTLVG